MVASLVVHGPSGRCGRAVACQGQPGDAPSGPRPPPPACAVRLCSRHRPRSRAHRALCTASPMHPCACERVHVPPLRMHGFAQRSKVRECQSRPLYVHSPDFPGGGGCEFYHGRGCACWPFGAAPTQNLFGQSASPSRGYCSQFGLESDELRSDCKQFQSEDQHPSAASILRLRLLAEAAPNGGSTLPKPARGGVPSRMSSCGTRPGRRGGMWRPAKTGQLPASRPRD